MKNQSLAKTSSGLVMLIGLYMIYLGWGGMTPPLLSGVAFLLIGYNSCSMIK